MVNLLIKQVEVNTVEFSEDLITPSTGSLREKAEIAEERQGCFYIIGGAKRLINFSSL